MGKVATSPAAQDRLRKQERSRERTHTDDVRELAKSPAFRRWLWRTTEQLNVHGYGPTDPALLARHEGRRSAGVDMLAELRSLAPDAYALMVAEQMAALADDQIHKQAAEDAAEAEEP